MVKRKIPMVLCGIHIPHGPWSSHPFQDHFFIVLFMITKFTVHFGITQHF